MLRRLEVRGFKSFALQATLDLGPGVNVIVGPNGSGKSNLAEALVWAMGEQRASKIRASGMGEVVFSGGEGRQPAGLAEVSMTLTELALDEERPAETQVTRRVTRAGDAAYRLNGVGCRLLDIHEELATVGLGPDALAVIRQGQVEAVCAARPAELRAVIEEAAGVALQKRRRRRAESKLNRVGERLDRARDLAVELEARRATLSRQASQAVRAAELDAEIESGRVRLAAVSAAAAARALAMARERLTSARAGLTAAQTELEAARGLLDEANRGVVEAERAREAALELARTLKAAGDRLASRAELAEERILQARRAMDRGRAEREAAVAARDDAERAATLAAERSELAQTALDEVEQRLAAARADHAERTEAAREARRQADDARAASDDAQRALTGARGRMERAARALAEAEARLQGLGGAAAALPDLGRLERRAEIAQGRASRWAERDQAARRALEDAAATRAAAEERRRAAAAELARTAGAHAAHAGRLGDGLEVEPGTERAVGAALGALADAPVTADVPHGLAAVDDGAPAAVVPAPTRGTFPAPQGARPLVSVIRACHEQARGHVERLLAQVWLVDDLRHVPAGHTGLFVTPAGEAYRPAQGVVERPASDWAQAALHRAAAERVEAAEAACGALAAAETRAREAVGAITSRVRAANRAQTSAESALGAGRAAAGRAAAELADATAARDAAARELESATAAEAPAAAALGEAAQREQDARAVAVRATEGLEEAARGLRDVETTASSARAELAAARVADAEAAERLAGIARRASAEDRAVDLTLPERALAALETAGRALTDRSRQASSEAGAAATLLTEAQRLRAEARQVVVGTETHVEGARAKGHEAELAVAAATARAEEHGPPPEEDPGEIDPDAERRRIEDLERRRRMMGNVNLLAAEELEEMQARLTDIGEQVADLESAAASLRGHMEGLDTTVADGFEELFSAVRDRFTQNIATLFPGGHGRLAEVEGEDGEQGIEVQVVPAGKRPRPLSMLSGGERSLVALAFCMAIAMCKPAPFYLLDEVEAALDDTNLRRFLALVRQLSDHTQFVLITHQQPTVEIADTLFGVTMGHDGVSQVVARRLDRTLEGRARPFVRRQLKAIQGGRA